MSMDNLILPCTNVKASLTSTNNFVVKLVAFRSFKKPSLYLETVSF